MKIPKLLGLLALFMFTAPIAMEAMSGGPDAYGYTWKDSQEADGPVFTWIDIRNRPNAVEVTGLADDNSVGMFSMGWSFHYYWGDYDRVKIGSNGWISFDNVGNFASCFPNIPASGDAGENTLAAFMGDLTFSSNTPQNPNPGTIHYWSNLSDSFVVQYTDVPWWQNNVPDWIGRNTFQIILNGGDSSITFQYLNTDSSTHPDAGTCDRSFVLGIENLTGAIGLTIAEGGRTSIPSGNHAIRFFFPDQPLLAVVDASPTWVANPENGGQFVLVDQPLSLQTRIANVGNAALTGPVTYTASIRSHPAQNVIFAQTRTYLAGLQPSQDTLLQFVGSPSITQPGQYSYTVTTSHGQDANNTNNVKSVEIAAVAQYGNRSRLSYCTGDVPDGSIAWQGGDLDDGVAVKMTPPAFPTILDSVRFFVLGNDGNPATPMPHGFRFRIYGSSLNGQPDLNQLLLSQDILASDVVEDNWNSIPLTNPLTLLSGPVFIAWLQGGDGVSLATEQVGPISRRSYEILGGNWTPYRANETTEFLVEACVSMPVARQDAQISEIRTIITPNPTSGNPTLILELERPEKVTIQWTDATGIILGVFSTQAPKGKSEHLLPLSYLPAGLYTYSVRTSSTLRTGKIILTR
jgi:hypothetical protein